MGSRSTMMVGGSGIGVETDGGTEDFNVTDPRFSIEGFEKGCCRLLTSVHLVLPQEMAISIH